MRAGCKIALASLVLALLAWVGSAMLEFLFFSERTLGELLAFGVPVHQLYPRVHATLFLVIASLVLARAWTWRKQSQESLSKRSREVSLLRWAARRFGRALGPNQVYETLRTLVSDIMDCDALIFSSYDPRDNLIRCTYAWLDGERMESDQVAPVPLDTQDSGTQSSVIRTGEPVLLDDYRDQAETSNTRRWLDDVASTHRETPAQADEVRSALMVPLKLDQQVVGVVQVFSHRKGAYAGEDLSILEDLALQMGPASANAVLHQQAQKEYVEEALRESEHRFRSIVEQSEDGIVLIDERGTIIEWNRGQERITGLNRDEVLGRPLWDVQLQLVPAEARTPEKRERLKAGVLGLLKTGRAPWASEITEYETQLPGGDRRIVQSLVFPIRTDQGSMAGSISRDVTRLRGIEEALRRSEAEKATVLNSMSELVVYQDMEMRILWANKAAGESLGLSPGALKGRHCYELWHHRKRPCKGCPVLKARKTGRPQQAEMSTPDGRQWLIRAELARDTRGDVLGVVEVRQDITERKQAEAELREQLHFLQQLIDAIPNPLFYTDTEGLYQGCNAAFAAHCGISQDKIAGKTVYDWVPKELAARYNALDLELLNEPGIQAFESRITDADGTQHEVITTKATYSDTQGNVAGLVGVMVDITERKHLEDQLRQAQKMEAIGKLAGGIAHDFNNVLTVINGCSEILLENLWPDDPARHDVEQIRKAGERGAALTQQLLTFSRRQVPHMGVIDLNDVLQGMAEMLHRVIGEDVRLHLALAKDLGSVRADRGQIEQVVMNLTVNARDAMPAGGVLTLETKAIELHREYTAQHMGVRPGPHIMLAVSDTGGGMTPEVMEHLFEPFFTTKQESGGTGLGLSTVYGIVKQSEGTIHAYSEPGQGTTFRIYLPLVREQASEANDQPIPAALPRGTETILVVEDEETVRSLAVRMLERFGYTALEAPTGSDALALYRQHAGPVHLVLTDVVMPEMSGLDFVRRMREVHDDFEVLYMSGYTDDAIAHHGVLTPGVSFIEKPFTTETLAVKVRQVLDCNGRRR